MIDTALAVVTALEQSDLPDPMICQDDEAVILLWHSKGRTIAATITDGQAGYVIRENGGLVALQHSLQPLGGEFEKVLFDNLDALYLR